MINKLLFTLEADVGDIMDRLEKFFSQPLIIFLEIVLLSLILFLVLRSIYMKLRRKRLSRIVYEREFSEEGVFEGDEIYLIETIRNTGFFPLLFVDVESYIYNDLKLEGFVSDGKDSMQYNISRFHLMPYMQIRRKHRIHCNRRGHYALEVCTVYDKKAPITLNAPTEIYVYPKMLELDISRYAQGKLQGDFTSQRPLYTDPFSFSGIRDYRFGDLMSEINFKASAKSAYGSYSGSPFKVNSRDFCASRKVMVCMDFHLPMGSKIDGKEYEKRAERGLSYASALVNQGIFGGYAVGFAANCKTISGDMSLRFPCESGREQMIQILKEMAKIFPREGASFAAILEGMMESGVTDTEIIIICYAQTDEAAIKANMLERYGNCVNYIILDSEPEENN